VQFAFQRSTTKNPGSTSRMLTSAAGTLFVALPSGGVDSLVAGLSSLGLVGLATDLLALPVPLPLRLDVLVVARRAGGGDERAGNGDAAEVKAIGGKPPAVAGAVADGPVRRLVATSFEAEAVVHRVDPRLEVIHVPLVVRPIVRAHRRRGRNVEARIPKPGLEALTRAAGPLVDGRLGRGRRGSRRGGARLRATRRRGGGWHGQ
jgi:hypothetical protein